MLGPVSGGTREGEFYVTAYHWPFPQGYVLRCQTENQQGKVETVCERVLNFREAGQTGPTAEDVTVHIENKGSALGMTDRAPTSAPRSPPPPPPHVEEPAAPPRSGASLTCNDVKGLLAAHLTEAQMLTAVQGQTITDADLTCAKNAGVPGSVVTELARHLVP